MKTLNSWEELTLKELITLMNEILFTRFDTPKDLRIRVKEAQERIKKYCKEIENIPF